MEDESKKPTLPELQCKECGAEVKRDGEKFIRSCGHEGATILANMTATVRAHGGLRERPQSG